MSTDMFARAAMYPPEAGIGQSPIPYSEALLRWYQTLVLTCAVGVMFSNLPIYAYTQHAALLPKYFFFGLFLLLAPLVVIRLRALGAYLFSPFALWALAMITLNLIHLSGFSAGGGIGGTSLVNSYLEARNALVLTRIQYLVFAVFLGFVVFISDCTTYLRMFVVLAVLLPIAVLLDFLQPGLLYPLQTEGAVLGRAAAMFINPTMAAEALLLVFLFSCAVTSPKHRMLLYILLGAALLVTFTRAGIIAWLLLLPLLVVRRVLPKAAIPLTLMVLAGGLMLFGVFESYLGGRHDLESALANMQTRLNFFSSARLDDDSALERARVLMAGWNLFLENPFFGAGAGTTQFWSIKVSTHNQLLLLAVEYGILGAVLWGWMAVILFKGQFFANRGLQFAVAFLFVFMSMFTHLMLDSATYWLAAFGLASVRRIDATRYPRGVAP